MTLNFYSTKNAVFSPTRGILSKFKAFLADTGISNNLALTTSSHLIIAQEIIFNMLDE